MRPERLQRLLRVLDRRQPDLTVLMDDVHKAHNLAAVLRSCDAVGVLEAHAVSPGGEVRRFHDRSGGSAKWVPIRVHRRIEDACTALRATGHRLVAAHFSSSAVDYRAIDYTVPTALVLGAELMGVSTAAAGLVDRHVAVPMHGHVASLNVSVAAAVILFEAERQRRAAGCYDRPRLSSGERERLLFEWSYPRLASWCRARGLPYPPLDEAGDLAGDPRRGIPRT
jgi:tRNA (guanosine-2'-O-)-methyltransferase